MLYVVCELANWPLFTYHPATGRVDLGLAPPVKGEGPAMYWYGWTATTLIGARRSRPARHGAAAGRGQEDSAVADLDSAARCDSTIGSQFADAVLDAVVVDWRSSLAPLH